MRKSFLHGRSIVLAVGVLLAAAPVAAQEAELGTADCTATLAPESVRAGSEESEFVASLSRSIGSVDEVRIDPASGVEVGGAEAGAADSTSVTFHADLSTATAGQWSVTLVGSLGSCAGKLTVEPE